uniref:DUF3857 domain-containing protein n=1 Tax=Gelidibacter sp. TaxID=2018083 RepID=UPI00404AEFF4
MKLFYLTITLLFTSLTYSQSPFNWESYNVSKADITNTIFEKDSTANALVIYEMGNSYIDKKTFKLVTEVKKKIKILNREGFDKSIISILLRKNDKSIEKIKDLNGSTYNIENGEIIQTKLQDNEIYEENYNENFILMKFTLPNIKEGSIITYSYTIESPFIYKYRGWEFQSDVPKIYSQYNTSIPGIYEYHVKLVGFKKLEVFHEEIVGYCLEAGNGASADCVNTIYAMKDIPAFTDEEYMTTRSNYLSRIEYELKTVRHFDGKVDNVTKTWEIVDKELKTDNNVGRELGKKTGIVDVFPNNEIPNNNLEKAQAIYNYVQKTYTWNEKYDIFTDVSVKDLIKEKSGNVSEINILLHNLLLEHDIEVKPILLSTRSNGFSTKIFPVMSDFNYLINQVTIDNKTYFLDATDSYLSFGELPFRCLNQYGRLLDFKEGSTWIDIFPEKVSTIQYRFDLSLKENEELSGSIDVISNGYHALPLKRSYFKNPTDYLKSYKNKYASIEFTNHTVSTEDKTSYDFKERFEIQSELEIISDKIYFNPFLITVFDENPFKLQERTYPIDFGFKDAYLYSLKIQIHDSYQILETPKDLNFALPNNKGTILLTTKVDNNNLMIYYKFNFNESIYEPEYYPYLKEFLSKIVDIQKNSLIVLKKK